MRSSITSAVTFSPLTIYLAGLNLLATKFRTPPGASDIPSRAISETSNSCPMAALAAASPAEPPTASIPVAVAIDPSTCFLDACLTVCVPPLVKTFEATLPPSLPVYASIAPITKPLATALFLILL